jgi:hypothetical protein
VSFTCVVQFAAATAPVEFAVTAATPVETNAAMTRTFHDRAVR